MVSSESQGCVHEYVMADHVLSGEGAVRSEGVMFETDKTLYMLFLVRHCCP